MRKLIIMIVAILFLATGCATKWDRDINSDFETTVQNHQVEQTLQVRHKVQAIQNTMDYQCDDGTEACGVAKAFSKMIAADKISAVVSRDYEGERPTTGADVQKTMAGYTGRLITSGMTLGIIREVSGNQPTTTYNNKGDVKGSGNRSETHATAIGDQNEGLSSDSAMDSANPEETDNSVVEE